MKRAERWQERKTAGARPPPMTCPQRTSGAAARGQREPTGWRQERKEARRQGPARPGLQQCARAHAHLGKTLQCEQSETERGRNGHYARGLQPKRDARPLRAAWERCTGQFHWKCGRRMYRCPAGYAPPGPDVVFHTTPATYAPRPHRCCNATQRRGWGWRVAKKSERDNAPLRGP